MSRARALELVMPTVVPSQDGTDKDHRVIIGVDPHKLSHTATAVDPLTNSAGASLRIDASLAGYRELLRWARQFGERRWAIDNAKGLGRTPGPMARRPGRDRLRRGVRQTGATSHGGTGHGREGTPRDPATGLSWGRLRGACAGLQGASARRHSSELGAAARRGAERVQLGGGTVDERWHQGG
jgi:hypothetical protein